MGKQKRAGRMTGSGGERGRRSRKRKRGGAKLAVSSLERRREKELLLHLGPEGAPWGQPTETRALSTGPPRPPRRAGRESWLLLVSGIRERVNKNKVGSDNVSKSKSRGLVLLSTAAKLRVVAERDLGKEM